MSSSRLLSTRSKGKLSIQTSIMSNEMRSEVRKPSSGGSTLKEVSHVNETTTLEEFTDEITKDIGSKTIRHEQFKAHGASILKEVSHVNETATFGEVTDEITKDIGSKTVRHEKFKAHNQKLYIDEIMCKQIVKSERIINNSEKEANLSLLINIFEESEKENEEETHNKTKNNVEIHLKAG